MILPRPQKARTRIALAGAALSALLLLLLGVGARTTVRELTFRDIDEELRTLAIAVGSDFEMEGLGYQESLAKGLEANVFEFRLQHHSAILFDGERALTISGDLVRGSRWTNRGRRLLFLAATAGHEIEPAGDQGGHRQDDYSVFS